MNARDARQALRRLHLAVADCATRASGGEPVHGVVRRRLAPEWQRITESTLLAPGTVTRAAGVLLGGVMSIARWGHGHAHRPLTAVPPLSALLVRVEDPAARDGPWLHVVHLLPADARADAADRWSRVAGELMQATRVACSTLVRQVPSDRPQHVHALFAWGSMSLVSMAGVSTGPRGGTDAAEVTPATFAPPRPPHRSAARAMA